MHVCSFSCVGDELILFVFTVCFVLTAFSVFYFLFVLVRSW